MGVRLLILALALGALTAYGEGDDYRAATDAADALQRIHEEAQNKYRDSQSSFRTGPGDAAVGTADLGRYRSTLDTLKSAIDRLDANQDQNAYTLLAEYENFKKIGDKWSDTSIPPGRYDFTAGPKLPTETAEPPIGPVLGKLPTDEKSGEDKKDGKQPSESDKAPPETTKKEQSILDLAKLGKGERPQPSKGFDKAPFLDDEVANKKMGKLPDAKAPDSKFGESKAPDTKEEPPGKGEPPPPTLESKLAEIAKRPLPPPPPLGKTGGKGPSVDDKQAPEPRRRGLADDWEIPVTDYVLPITKRKSGDVVVDISEGLHGIVPDATDSGSGEAPVFDKAALARELEAYRAARAAVQTEGGDYATTLSAILALADAAVDKNERRAILSGLAEVLAAKNAPAEDGADAAEKAGALLAKLNKASGGSAGTAFVSVPLVDNSGGAGSGGVNGGGSGASSGLIARADSPSAAARELLTRLGRAMLAFFGGAGAGTPIAGGNPGARSPAGHGVAGVGGGPTRSVTGRYRLPSRLASMLSFGAGDGAIPAGGSVEVSEPDYSFAVGIAAAGGAGAGLGTLALLLLLLRRRPGPRDDEEPREA